MTRVLRPFFSYYGGKWRTAPRYPAPESFRIVEPFAGSAGYSLRYPDRTVILADSNPVISGLWRYLVSVSESEILALPDPAHDVDVMSLSLPYEARCLIGFWRNKGREAPSRTASAWARNPEAIRPTNYWGPAVRQRIASQLQYIRHWHISDGGYSNLPDCRATWFIDPPYHGRAGARYPHGSAQLDYTSLADWCKSRRGLVVVCEQEGADWLPFQLHHVAKTTEGSKRAGVCREVLWTRQDTWPRREAARA